MQRNRGKQQKGKDQRSLRDNQKYKGTFHPKMGTIKDRNDKDLLEAEEIKKRWKEYTEELYNTDLKDLDNHNAVVSHSTRHSGM